MIIRSQSLSRKTPISFFGTLVFCLFFSSNTNAQSDILKEKISISAKNETTSSVLNQISKKNNCFFSYDASIVDGNRPISLKTDKIGLDSALRLIFPDTCLKFQAVEKHIIIYRKKHQIEYQHNGIKKEIIEIQGIVYDAETREKIPFATIGVRGTNTGSVSNINGTFILKIPKTLIDSTVCVSNMGYSDIQIPVATFVEKPQIISLKRTYIAIQEVIVRNKEPIALLKSALARKQENYVSIPALLTGFYREGIERGKRQISCSEAVVEIYKSSYTSSFADDQIKVLQSRKFINSDGSDSVSVKLKAGPAAAILLDFMANDIEFLSGDCFERYKYRTTDIVTYNDKSAYVIEFEQKDSYDGSSYKGRLFVETINLAIIGAEFEVNTEKSTKNNSNFVVKKKLNLRTDIKSAKYTVGFKKVDNKLIINHVRGDILLNVKKRKTLFAADYSIYFELTVFDVETESVKRFNRDEVLKKNIIFIDGNFNYNADFWGDYNYISPEELPEEILQKLIRDVKKNNTQN